jgi:polysaccharide export outer membrane protein
MLRALLAPVHIALALGIWLAGGPVSARAAPPAATDAAVAPLSAQEAQTYKLGAGDKLQITTFDEPQLTGEFIVGSDGCISLVWIGEVKAQGRTADEVRGDIEARLKDGYILNPTVSLQVLASRPFYILGEVNKPGQYSYSNGLTVMSAVATAGGFTYRANTKKAFIKHAGDETETREPLTPATAVQAGDTIRIGERYF